MNKILSLFIVLFLFQTSLFSQNEYIVRCSVRVDAGSCGSCSDNPIGLVTLWEVPVSGPAISKGNIINSTNYQQYGVWQTMYIKITKGSRVEFRFNDPTGGGAQVLTYNAIPDNHTVSPNHYDHNDGAWIKYHTVYLDASANTFAPYDMINLADYPSGNTDVNVCEDSPDFMYIQFNVPNGENLSCDAYLCAYTYDSIAKRFDRFARVQLNGLSWDTYPHSKFGDQYVIHITQFMDEAYYGKNIYFKVETLLSGLSIFNDYQSRSFFQRVRGPSSIEASQMACEPFTKINVVFPDNSGDLPLNLYEFRARPLDSPEETSNIIKLNKTITGSNSLTLEVDESSRNLISEAAGRYAVQLYVSGQPFYTELISTHKCAWTNNNFNIPARPSILEIFPSPQEYTFNNHIYHVSGPDATDGRVMITLTAGDRTRVSHFRYSFNDGDWLDVVLQNIDETTFLFNSLAAGNYKLIVIDNDGCESAQVSFELVAPNKLQITDLDSTLVNCHLNNIGEHADAQIAIHFTGGIGPYQLEVIDGGNNSIYTRDVIADDFWEGDDICHIYTPESLPIGTYKVVVTDNSGIETEDNIEVTSNPELILSATPIPYDCYGSADGAVLLRLENRENLAVNYGLNGDSIYRSFVDTAYYDYLTKGIYSAGVVNTRGCKDVVENIEINQPEQMEINGIVTNPVCYNSFDGSIITNVTGGNGEYDYKWSNNNPHSSLTGLNKGSYTLVVTDSKGCTSEDIYTVIPPHAPSANWVETSATLCTGNTKTLDGGVFSAYEWRKDGNLVSTERVFNLEEAGLYTLKLTNELGCFSTDTFTLELSNHPLDAVLLLKDSALVNESVEAIDVTWPVPDSINWFFDREVSLGNYNEWSQQFSASEEGIVNVTLRAWYGGCFSDSTKNIVIYYSDEEIDTKQAEEMPLIIGTRLWPNPNDGNFRLEVKLSKKADILVQLYHIQNSSKLFFESYHGLDKYEIPFQFNNLTTGVYLVLIRAEKEQQSIKFIVK